MREIKWRWTEIGKKQWLNKIGNGMEWFADRMREGLFDGILSSIPSGGNFIFQRLYFIA